jgi:hypothetical protein
MLSVMPLIGQIRLSLKVMESKAAVFNSGNRKNDWDLGATKFHSG